MAESDQIARWYFEKDFKRPDFDFDDFLVDAIQETTIQDPIRAELLADTKSNRIWDTFRKQVNEESERGFYPTFRIVSRGSRRLFWLPQFFPSFLSRREKNLRLRIQSRKHISRSIHSNTSREYEALCVLACNLSGATHSVLTSQSNEFGIDFFAVIPSVGKSHLFNGGTGPMRIIGQCKMHSGQVVRSSLQQFSSALTSVQQRSEDVKDLIPSWFVRQRGPIVGWFVAHNGLQSGARDFANRYGIIHSDSRDLAEVITMSRAWQPSDGVMAPVDLMYREIDYILDSA